MTDAVVPPARFAYGAVVGCVAALAVIALVVPVFFLTIGFQALGAALGWWLGDSSVNDGEERWATTVGAMMVLGILAAACGTLLGLRRTFGIRSPAPAVIATMGLTVVAILPAMLIAIFSR